uniref:dTCF n=1 Tax=Acrobeloides nanus TaxID=290746 RepID=A0A914EKK1_9BILA
MTTVPDDGADEVKVFRKNDSDDVLDSAQSSHQLNEDKKDVAFETEMETQSAPDQKFFHPAMTSAFTPVSPSFMPFMPFFVPLSPGNYGYPSLFGQHSPNFMMAMGAPPFAAAAALASQAAAAAASTSGVANPYLPFNAQRNLNALNQMRISGMNGSPMSSLMNIQPSTANGHANSSEATPKRHKIPRERKDKSHIKKPLNAFMWFMKENRPRLLQEAGNAAKQSAELNRTLGKMWHELSKEDQKKYYELSQKERENHAKMYPNWSARDNYAINKKKRRKREKSMDNNEQKKCRARFGVNNQDAWCKHCRRKKRCLMVSRDLDSPIVSSTTNPATPSHFGSPASALSGVNTMKDDCSSAMSSSSDSESEEREDSVEPSKPFERVEPPSHINHPLPVSTAQILGHSMGSLLPATSTPIADAINRFHAISTANSFQMH